MLLSHSVTLAGIFTLERYSIAWSFSLPIAITLTVGCLMKGILNKHK